MFSIISQNERELDQLERRRGEIHVANGHHTVHTEKVCVCERERRLCLYCSQGVFEKELHVLTMCPRYDQIQKQFYLKFEIIWPDFKKLENDTQLKYLLG